MKRLKVFGSYRILVLLQLEYQKEEKNMTK